jgi:multiple sugar transport system ATP-binding protein
LPLGVLPDADLPAGTRTVGARTEHLRIEKSPNGASDGVVDWIEHLGDQSHLHVKLGSHKLITLSPPDTPLAAGDKVTIRYHHPLCFDADGARLSGGAQ